MNKKTSDELVKLHQAAVDKYNTDDWGVIFTDGRWTVGFRAKGKLAKVGHGDTPQEAYENALHDAEGTTRPPF